jgi:hypothetical protein
VRVCVGVCEHEGRQAGQRVHVYKTNKGCQALATFFLQFVRSFPACLPWACIPQRPPLLTSSSA